MFQGYMYRLDGLTGFIEKEKNLIKYRLEIKRFHRYGTFILLWPVSSVTPYVYAYIAQRDFVELSDVSVSPFFHDIKFI
jgi:hypothetical protein